MKKLFTLFLWSLLCYLPASGQISTQGKDFWVNFLPNYTAGYVTTVYISAKDACSGTIVNSSTGYSVPFSVGANSAISLNIPISNVVVGAVETATYAAVHIEATDTISAFGLNMVSASSDGSFFIPTQSLGINYRVACYPGLAGYPSQIGIWAVNDSTDIEITTTQNSTGSFIAGTPKTIRLNKGQCYMITAAGDLTGSLVRSINPCKPIAVSSGSALCKRADHLSILQSPF